MPTKRPRHTVTETEPLAVVLNELRVRTAGARLDFAELVRIGAEARLRELDDQQRQVADRAAAKERFLTRSLTAQGIDVAAAREVGERGWSHD